jgi:hypothetical protein
MMANARHARTMRYVPGTAKTHRLCGFGISGVIINVRTVTKSFTVQFATLFSFHHFYPRLKSDFNYIGNAACALVKSDGLEASDFKRSPNSISDTCFLRETECLNSHCGLRLGRNEHETQVLNTISIVVGYEWSPRNDL